MTWRQVLTATIIWCVGLPIVYCLAHVAVYREWPAW